MIHLKKAKPTLWKQEMSQQCVGEYSIGQAQLQLLEEGKTLFVPLSEQEGLAIALYKGSEWKNIPEKTIRLLNC